LSTYARVIDDDAAAAATAQRALQAISEEYETAS